jgi:hypothetical protein
MSDSYPVFHVDINDLPKKKKKIVLPIDDSFEPGKCVFVPLIDPNDRTWMSNRIRNMASLIGKKYNFSMSVNWVPSEISPWKDQNGNPMSGFAVWRNRKDPQCA